MFFAVDIDGTLCYANIPMYAARCVEHFALQIANECLASIKREDFLALPEVAAKRDEIGAARFDHEVGWMLFDPLVLRASLTIPGAVEGVHRLAALGEMAYYTARFSKRPERHSGLTEATQAWLAEHGFPDGKVVHCDAIPGKLARVAELIQETDEYVVLIDDSYARIIDQLPKLADDIVSVLRSRMTLVAMRTKERPEACDVRVVALPHWRAIDAMIKEVFHGDSLAYPR